LAAKKSTVMPDFGAALINPRADGSGAYAYLRFPNFRFRPGQADFLHFDLWTESGRNLLRDSGSYSYADETALTTFPSIAAHNTVQFDGREPMRKLTRFLYGDWVKGTFDAVCHYGPDGVTFQAGYRDFLGASHRRWKIADTIGGYARNAVLRWRLIPGEWRLEGDTVIGPGMTLTVRGNQAPVRISLSQGWESRDYLSKSQLPVLEAQFSLGTTDIVTEFSVTSQ
jgi:hypothetical protein